MEGKKIGKQTSALTWEEEHLPSRQEPPKPIIPKQQGSKNDLSKSKKSNEEKKQIK